VKSKGKSIRMSGASIGGGNIKVQSVDHFDVSFTGTYPTLSIYHEDRSGVIAGITQVMKETGRNIGYMDVDRTSRNGEALTVIEVDQTLDESIVRQMNSLSFVQKVVIVDINQYG